MRFHFCFLISILLLVTNGSAAPYTPASDNEVLERLPFKPGDPAIREIRALRATLSRDPQNLDLAIRLAQQYFGQATAQGDPRYVGYAQAALKPWWDLPQPPTSVLLMRATLLQYRHDFAGALADLEQALKRDPAHVGAWSLRAVIHLA